MEIKKTYNTSKHGGILQHMLNFIYFLTNTIVFYYSILE